MSLQPGLNTTPKQCRLHDFVLWRIDFANDDSCKHMSRCIALPYSSIYIPTLWLTHKIINLSIVKHGRFVFFNAVRYNSELTVSHWLPPDRFKRPTWALFILSNQWQCTDNEPCYIIKLSSDSLPFKNFRSDLVIKFGTVSLQKNLKFFCSGSLYKR